MQYRKKGEAVAAEEAGRASEVKEKGSGGGSGGGQQAERGGRKSTKQRGAGQQYRPKQDNQQTSQYQVKQSTPGAPDNAQNVSNQEKETEHGGKQSGRQSKVWESKPVAESQQNQPKYRVKGGDGEQTTAEQKAAGDSKQDAAQEQQPRGSRRSTAQKKQKNYRKKGAEASRSRSQEKSQLEEQYDAPARQEKGKRRRGQQQQQQPYDQQAARPDYQERYGEDSRYEGTGYRGRQSRPSYQEQYHQNYSREAAYGSAGYSKEQYDRHYDYEEDRNRQHGDQYPSDFQNQHLAHYRKNQRGYDDADYYDQRQTEEDHQQYGAGESQYRGSRRGGGRGANQQRYGRSDAYDDDYYDDYGREDQYDYEKEYAGEAEERVKGGKEQAKTVAQSKYQPKNQESSSKYRAKEFQVKVQVEVTGSQKEEYERRVQYDREQPVKGKRGGRGGRDDGQRAYDSGRPSRSDQYHQDDYYEDRDREQPARSRGGRKGKIQQREDYYDSRGYDEGRRARQRDPRENYDYDYDYCRDYAYQDWVEEPNYDRYDDEYYREDYDQYERDSRRYDDYDQSRRSYPDRSRKSGKHEEAEFYDPRDQNERRPKKQIDVDQKAERGGRNRGKKNRDSRKRSLSRDQHNYEEEDDEYYRKGKSNISKREKRNQKDDDDYGDDYDEYDGDEQLDYMSDQQQSEDTTNKKYVRKDRNKDGEKGSTSEQQSYSRGGKRERGGRQAERDTQKREKRGGKSNQETDPTNQPRGRNERKYQQKDGTNYREKAGNNQETTSFDEIDQQQYSNERHSSVDEYDRKDDVYKRKRKDNMRKRVGPARESNRLKDDDRNSMGEIDERVVDDFEEDEFKWDDKDFEEDDENDYWGLDDSTHGGTSMGDHTSKSVTGSISSYQGGGPGGNNQVSRKYYQMGPTTDQIKSPCTVMMVAEKPSIALSITEALCGKNFTKRSGPAKGIPIYTFKGHFKGHSANFKVTSVAGHVYNRDFPKEYQNRTKDPAILFDAPTVKKCDPRSRPVAKLLQMVAKNLDFMVLWLDCDKEGENICFEVLDICKQFIPKSSNRVQRVFRAKFSSIAKKDIVNAFEGLKAEPNFNEAISVDARQVLDLKIGVAFSRFQTMRLAEPIRKAGIRMLTYGPCQTPTLGFCVDQAEKIKKFVPETYWRIEADILGEKGRKHTIKWCRGKVFDKTAVNVIHDRLRRNDDFKEAEVVSVKRNNVKQTRPQGLNTVKLLKIGSQSFGMSAHETMRIAEHLYLNGYTTYPRTESTTFSGNFNFKEVLSALKEHDQYGSYASNLLKKGFNKPRKGVDAGDHPPITPVKAANPGQLRDREYKIYEYITANFLACISEDAVYETLRCELLISEEKFKLKGQILKEDGFLEVMPWQRHSDLNVPHYEIGDIIDIVSTRVTETKTEPPGYLTEAELIEKMEKHAIGTDASIPTHIANIIERNYVTVIDPGRKLVPTALGHALVKGYCEIDPELVLPQVRSNIEKSCELIAKGKADFQKVMSHVLSIFKNKFNYFRLSVGTMERILMIMVCVGDENNQNSLTNKINLKDESKNDKINFCLKCFRGHLCIQYHVKKGWGLKCDTCHWAVRLCQGAARIQRATGEDSKCKECNSYKIDVYYKESSPFSGTSHVGCFLCDSQLSSLIKNTVQNQQQKLMTAAEAEEAQRAKEERRRLKEEKKAQKEKEKEAEAGAGAAAGGGAAPTTDQGKDKKKKPKSKTNKAAKGAKAAGDLLTPEERMNEFMKKFSGQNTAAI